MHRHDNIPQVAILVSTSRGWGRRIVKGILKYANQVGPWHIWIQAGTAETLDSLPKGWRGDGVIARVATKELGDALDATGLPVVNVSDFSLEGFSAPNIRTDDKTGTRLALEHFLERGLKNLAFVGPVFNPNPASYAESYVSEAKDRGLNCEIYPMIKDDPDRVDSLVKWLTDLPKPVGVLVWGHGYGREVVDCCMEAGISVPHDVAVLGGSYDELLSHACFPALSGVISPTEQIGYRAAQYLHKMMNGEKIPHETTYVAPRGVMERLSTDTLALEDEKLVKVISYIKSHAFEPITMDDILKAVPMARRSMERRFQQAFGCSPVDEIRRIRINRARKLLAETDMSMQDIAEACCYATYNYLTHVFKRTTGMTPRDYRKQFRT